MRRLLLLFAVVLACSPATGPDPVATWGGADASLTLSRASGALRYPCGAGTIAPGWTLDGAGRFAGTGVHYFGGGPVPSSGRPPHPATYTGVVTGDEFVLTVAVPDVAQTLGPFRMVRGGPVVVERCL